MLLTNFLGSTSKTYLSRNRIRIQIFTTGSADPDPKKWTEFATLVLSITLVRGPSFTEYLPGQDPVAPHVADGGVLPVVEGLRGRPLDRDLLQPVGYDVLLLFSKHITHLLLRYECIFLATTTSRLGYLLFFQNHLGPRCSFALAQPAIIEQQVS